MSDWLQETLSVNNQILSDKLRLYLILLLYSFFVFAHAGHYAPSAVSRQVQLQALLGDRTLSVDRYEGRTSDLASIDGKWYSDKAPGTTLICMPGYWISLQLLKMTDLTVDDEEWWIFTSWITCALVIAPLVTFGAVMCYETLRLGMTVRNSYYLTLFLFLGTPVLPNATMLMSHSIVVALIFCSIRLVSRPHARGKTVCIGSLCALAVLCEYTAFPAVLGIFALVRGDLDRFFYLVIGFAPVALLHGIYTQTLFSEWIFIPYSGSRSMPVETTAFGFALPDAMRGIALLFSPSRGLLLLSPLLLIAFCWISDVWRSGRRAAVLLSTQLGVYTMLFSAYWDWHAGPVFGARYLVVIIPFFALAFRELDTKRLLSIPVQSAGWAGVALFTFVTLFYPNPSEGSMNPLVEVVIPSVMRGQLQTTNLLELLGVPITLSFLAFGTYVVWLFYRSLMILKETDRTCVAATSTSASRTRSRDIPPGQNSL